ncbi:hypothetical protein [Hymenobacter terrenus]|uniref:hypothetical protein n=1 Tax=Hymenobacter terrenus TaxID=1629124 RepID=UPI0006194D05|nr:hypothetical protein [Hymenobacter terrenus]
MPRYQYSQIAIYDAKGGPEKATYYEGDSHEATPTQTGRFIVARVEKHISPKKYMWSAVPWGTPLRVNAAGTVEVQLHGRWQPLTDMPTWKAQYGNDQVGVRVDIENSYKKMITPLKKHLKDVGTIPKTWIFNDFGHVAVKYFEDLNHNGRQDSNEKPSNDFIHTTPYDELYTWFNATTAWHVDINLAPSHGCIHLRPVEIDKLLSSGYLKPGASLEVHSYAARHQKLFTVNSKARRHARTEVHFFPGEHKLVVYAVAQA